MTQPIDAQLAELSAACQAAKQSVKEAQAKLLQTEVAIYNLVREQLPEKGTSTFGDIKVVTGFTENWDQDRIGDIWNIWPDEQVTPFPFDTEWKPDCKQLSYLREHRPELYHLLSPALTLKPKKPAFSVKE